MERISENKGVAPNAGRLIIGFLFIFFGGMLLSKHYNWLPYEIYDYVFSWQMVLIAIGGFGLAFGKKTTFNLVLIIIGLFFMLAEIYHFPFELRKLIWPAIFIIIGILFITNRGGNYGRHGRINKSTDSNDFFDDTFVFGGGKTNVISKNFKGGRITSIFGGSEYYFLNSELADGINVIDVFSVFGGSKLVIPSDWKVKINVISIFGGFSDKRMNVIEPKEGKELHITGLVIFGGGDIKSI